MPRIIAGWAGSLQLAVPPIGTRPTSDRTREALFSMLEARDAVAGAAVLDLYAGSGAFALEALSRGAASAVLVESSARAGRTIRDNLARVRRAAPGPFDARLSAQSVRAFLATAGDRVDLVFLDPPYDLPDREVAADLVALVPRLAPGATVLVERAARSGAPTAPAGLRPGRARRYGDTAVHLFTVDDGSTSDD